MNKTKLTITPSKERYQILQKHAKLEERSLTNMIEIMIKTYDKLMKTKY